VKIVDESGRRPVGIIIGDKKNSKTEEEKI